MHTPDTPLTGSTWGHSRGYTPMVATAQRFHETHPSIRIAWTRRTLQAFADFSIDALAEEYDLLVIDHPWIAHAAAHEVLAPLDDLLPAALWRELEENQVGPSLRSYRFDDACWAVPIDAASPVSSYRPDLLAARGVDAPRTWDELLALADRGRVVMPAIPLDLLGHFNMLCGALGEEPFNHEDRVVGDAAGVEALATLRDLASRMPQRIFELNPIQVYEAMTTSDAYDYCLSGYGYSNYTRAGYAEHALRFTTMPLFANGAQLRGTLGGAGLAISARCRHPHAAAQYVAYVAGRACQQGLYLEAGGQPAHREAWLSDHANRLCPDYFSRTLADLDHAMLRPQYDGYLYYQDHACQPVWRFVKDGGDARAVLDEINELYRRSRTGRA